MQSQMGIFHIPQPPPCTRPEPTQNLDIATKKNHPNPSSSLCPPSQPVPPLPAFFLPVPSTPPDQPPPTALPPHAYSTFVQPLDLGSVLERAEKYGGNFLVRLRALTLRLADTETYFLPLHRCMMELGISLH